MIAQAREDVRSVRAANKRSILAPASCKETPLDFAVRRQSEIAMSESKCEEAVAPADC